jgi:hypothetical protein
MHGLSAVAQLGGQLGAAEVTRFGRLGKCTQDDPFQVRPEVRVQRARRRRRFLDMRQRDRQVGLAAEWNAACRHLVQHGAEAIDVRACAGRLAAHQLGRQVMH